MLNYFDSDQIAVYPSGFRGQDYPASKLTTEENLTHLQSYSGLENDLRLDDRDSNYYILTLKGYVFRFEIEDLEDLLDDLLPSSDQKYIYHVYASIKLRSISGSLGYVLNNYENSGTNYLLDQQQTINDPSYFQGLRIDLSSAEKASDLTNNLYYLEIGCFVKDVGNNPTDTYVFVPGKHTFSDYFGNELIYSDNVTVGDNQQQQLSGELVIPKNIVYNGNYSEISKIGDRSFHSLSSVTSVRIPATIIDIGTDCFDYCSGITTIYYDGDIKGWCSITGLGIHSLMNYAAASKDLYINNQLISGKLIIPSDVEKVGVACFQKYTKITSLEIQAGVLSISSFAFSSCTNLSSISLSEGLLEIDGYAFYKCPITNLVIPSTVIRLGAGSFQNCSNLSSVTIGSLIRYQSPTPPYSNIDTYYSDLRRIESYAFQSCTSLTTLTIPDNVIKIEYDAFKDSGLTTLYIGSSVTYLEGNSLRGCSSLKYLYIGNESGCNLTYIPSTAFNQIATDARITIYTYKENIENYSSYPWGAGASATITFKPIIKYVTYSKNSENATNIDCGTI